MIIDVEKYIFIGAKKDLDAFFEKAQQEGFIEFLHPQGKKKEFPREASLIIQAIKILKKHPLRDQLDKEPPILAETMAERVIHAADSIENLNEKKRLLESEIARIQIFGDFNLDDVHFLENKGNRFLQYYSLKTAKAKELDLPKELIYVGTEYDLDYFVGVHKEKKKYPGFIEIHIEKPIGVLKAHLESVKKEIRTFEENLKKYTAYFTFFQKSLIDKINAHSLQTAKEEIADHMNASAFSIEAWVPSNKREKLDKLLQPFAIHAEKVGADKEDRVPTYMENKSFSHIGEDLVKVYDIPATTDKDPSPWVIWAFSLFYAVIVADAGYGVLYLFLALFLKWKFPNWQGAMKRFRTLIFTISLFSIAWGVLTASYFGIQIGPDSPIRKSSLIHYLAKTKAEYHIEMRDDTYEEYVKEFPNLKNVTNGHEFLEDAVRMQSGKPEYKALSDFYDSILMEFSLLIGVIHLALAFLRNLRQNWSGVGWIAGMAGGYLFFPSIIGSTSLFNFTGMVPKEIAFPLGEQLLYYGIGASVVLGIIQHKLGGLHEIMNIIQVFADILSYLRLYALGLASMIVADTFNNIGLEMGLLGGGFLVILLGHGVNISIGVMGGVIHGLRLNFLEWYHYCFEGGGKLFNPLKLLNK